MLFIGIYCISFSQIKKETKIVGHIFGNTEKSIQIGNKTIELSTNGNYHLDLNIEKPAFFTLQYKNEEMIMYLEPGEYLKISFNADNVSSSVRYKGNSSRIDDFLKNKPAIDKSVNNYLNTRWLTNKWHSPELDSVHRCISVIDSLKNAYFTPLKTFLSENKNVSKQFVNLYKAEVDFTLNIQLLKVIDYRAFNSKDRYKVVGLFPEINQYLCLTKIDNPEFIDLQQYRNYCGYWLYLKGTEEIQNNPQLYTSDHRWLDVMIVVVQRLFKNRDVLDFWLHDQVRGYIDNNGIKNIENNMERFNSICKSEEFKEDVDSLYNKELLGQKDHLIRTYKTVNGFVLDAHIFIPKQIEKGARLPAMVYFHGGSWYEGKPEWNFGYSEKFVNVCIEYRTKHRHGSTEYEEVSDAKSAIRWLRIHADELHIDPDKIIGTGTSAGAHLALCTALAGTLDEPDENLNISSKPNALVLNCAGYDATIYFPDSEREKALIISPLHLVQDHLPPMLMFHGTKDVDTPYGDAQKFLELMKAHGNHVRLESIEGSGHFLWENENYWKVFDTAKNEFFKEIGI
jgi:acetyl esterase/lipase